MPADQRVGRPVVIQRRLEALSQLGHDAQGERYAEFDAPLIERDPLLPFKVGSMNGGKREKAVFG